MDKFFKIICRSHKVNFRILAKDEKSFLETEQTLLRKQQLERILPSVPFLVSPEGEIFLAIVDTDLNAFVRFVVDGATEDEDGSVVFTHIKAIKFR